MSLRNFYKDKVVLITGASMGIGKELARQVLELGGKAVLTARNAERLDAVKQEFKQYSDRMLIHSGDVTSYEDNILLMVKIHQHFGKLNVQINNAGMSCYGTLKQTQPEVARQVIDINIYGSIFPVMTALKQFNSSLDSIFFVSSIAGFHGLPEYAAYSLSKRSLQALAQSLRIELYEEKIFVGIAYVGFTENEEIKKVIAANGELEAIPKRPGHLLSTRQETARKILTQIKNRKHAETHGWFGKFINFMAKHFPYLMGYILRKRYYKSQKS